MGNWIRVSRKKKKNWAFKIPRLAKKMAPDQINPITNYALDIVDPGTMLIASLLMPTLYPHGLHSTNWMSFFFFMTSIAALTSFGVTSPLYRSTQAIYFPVNMRIEVVPKNVKIFTCRWIANHHLIFWLKASSCKIAN